MFLLHSLKSLFEAIKHRIDCPYTSSNIIMVFLCWPCLTWADLPLTVENLISDKQQWRIETSVLYSSLNSEGVQTSQPITLQIDESSFLTFPTQISGTQSNTDFLVTVLGLHYGLTGQTEIFARGSHLYENQRGQGVDVELNQSQSQMVDAWLGFNHQLSYDDETPAVIGFIEMAIREKHSQSTAQGKSWTAGLTLYRAIDPVVLSLNTSYRWHQTRDNGNDTLEPGNVFMLNPSVAFAVNDRVTLSSGVQWSTQKAEKINGIAQSFRRTRAELVWGFGYGVSQSSVIDVAFNTSASGSNDLRVQWLYSL